MKTNTMQTVKMATVLAFAMSLAVVVLNGIGLHVLGLRHSGAHILVEAISAFLVAWVAALAVLATRSTAAPLTTKPPERLEQDSSVQGWPRETEATTSWGSR